jgi:predicted patatin/cPLA2 family phospholipase
METSQTGLVLEGGGFRGIFTAGILDAFLENNIHFPYLIGVSAGAAYGVSYVSAQFERNLAVNKVVSDKRYCSLANYLKTGSYFDWDFVYREVPMHIVPFDYEAFARSGKKFRVGLTNCNDGNAGYFNIEGSSPERFRDLLAATSALPLVSRIQYFEGKPYLDGGIADAIPVEKALEEGNTRVVVILTRPSGYRKSSTMLENLVPGFYHRYPQLSATMKTRVARYNHAVEKVEQLARDGKAFIIRPVQPVAVSRMENNTIKLDEAYQVAREEGRRILPALIDWLG